MSKIKQTALSFDLNPGELKSYVGNVQVLSEIFNNFSDCIYIIDSATLKPVYMNKSLLHLLGYSAQQIKTMGSSWPKIITHPDDLVLIEKHISNLNLLHGIEPSRILYRMKNSKNEWRNLESIDAPFCFDKEMKATKLIGITRDVTDHKHFFDSTSQHTPFQQHQHRCRTCNKLLGTENLKTAVIDVKCNRCGDINSFSHPLNV
jgi:PAS domain S-box-containing protein